MRIIRNLDELNRDAAALGRAQGLGGVLVPTMGALHAGHRALMVRGVEIARTRSIDAGCIVSIFVNPTQFNDPADLARYPRTLDADLELCRDAGVSAVFAPDHASVYPAQPVPVPDLPDVATMPGLEDAHRPGHFSGVCQVVMRLFTLLQPSAAIFGEKDWQQLQVVRAMTARSQLPIDIVGHTTARESDGLAMSSRNRFLSPAQRVQALAIPRALERASRCSEATVAEGLMKQTLLEAGLQAEYAVVRDAASLGPVTPGLPARALIAAHVGSVRLIDNASWPR